MGKTGFLHLRKQRRNQVRANDQRLCFCYTDSTTLLPPKSEISSLEMSPVAVQPGLCGTWSETPKTGFLTPRLIFKHTIQIVGRLAKIKSGLSANNVEAT